MRRKLDQVYSSTHISLDTDARYARIGTIRNVYPPRRELYPEGVALASATGIFYVGNTENGTVYEGNVNDDPGNLLTSRQVTQP